MASVTLIDRTFNLNGKQYRYYKEGRHPYDKFDEEFTKGQIKDGEFARTDTTLAEIKPNGEEEVLIHDMNSAYIEHNKGVQRAHGRYNNTSGNSVCVVKESDGSIRRHIRTPKDEKIIYGTKISLGNGDWLDLSTKKSFQECIQESTELISDDSIEFMKRIGDAETVERHIDFVNKRLRSLNELGENAYKQLIRIIKKFRV